MKRKPARKKNGLLRVLLFLLLSGVAAVIIGYFAVTSWIRNYLRSEACREMVAQQIGNAAHARCELEPFLWSGWTAYSAKASLQPEGLTGWKQMEADGLQASLDWNGVRRGMWHLPGINLDWLRVSLAEAAKSPAPADGAIFPPPDAGMAAPRSDAPAWVRRWLPVRTEIDEVDVRKFDLKPSSSGAGVAIDAVHLKARPAADDGAWKVSGDAGRVFLPGISEPFHLRSAVARFDSRAFVLHDASARWLGESEVTARGESPFAKDKGWSYCGRVSGLDLRHVLPDEWEPNLSGMLDGDYEASAEPGGGARFKGTLNVKGGVVQNLFVMNLMADYTNTERFRRIVWDQVRGNVEIHGALTRVSNMELQSNGLIRIEGGFVMQGEVVDGMFLVGISPGTLSWKENVAAEVASGAARAVFTEPHPSGPPGFLWTKVRVTGTRGSVIEDLSPRLALAMGLEIPKVALNVAGKVVGKSVELLGTTGATMLKEGSEAISKGAGDVIKDAGEGAGKGLDALKGFLPLLPK